MDFHSENFYGCKPQACVDVASGILSSVYVGVCSPQRFYRSSMTVDRLSASRQSVQREEVYGDAIELLRKLTQRDAATILKGEERNGLKIRKCNI